MKAWWVNQNQTYQAEVQGGFLWSPKTSKGGRRNPFYDNMQFVEPGDLIFSFCDTRIKAVGEAQDRAQTAEKPDFGTAGKNWDIEGWLVPVEYIELKNQLRPKEFIAELRPYLPAKYSPLRENGDSVQAYLFALPDALAKVLLEKIGMRASEFRMAGADEAEGNKAENDIQGRTDIGPTEKQQLVSARRGQGAFKSNVRLNEVACRITGVADGRLLIASHIKPWSVSSDKEKLDGCNGLLLSPHVDRLFDRGLISFQNNGDLLISTRLDKSVLQRWSLDCANNVGAFSPKQCEYLEFHRLHRFKP